MFGLGLRKPITTEEAPFYSSLSLWLAADDGPVFSGVTGLVSEWNDLSGQGNTFTQSTVANQPTWSANGGPNGLPAVLFTTALSTYLSSSNQPINGSSPGCTIFAVQMFNAVNVRSQFSLNLSFNLGFTTDFNGNGERGIYATGLGLLADTNNSATTSWEQWTCTSINGAQTLRVNGAARTLTPADYNPTATGYSTLGAYDTSLDFFGGGIAEIITYQAVLSTSQILAVEAYLQGKYGI